jgi:hypothetical protein
MAPSAARYASRIEARSSSGLGGRYLFSSLESGSKYFFMEITARPAFPLLDEVG